MTANDVVTTVGLGNLPGDIRSLCSLDKVDYADHFIASAAHGAERSAEEWARVILEQTTVGRAAPRLWRLLGLQLGPTGSSRHVQGWRIDASDTDWIRLETRSPLMTGQAVARRTDDAVSIALFLRFDRLVAALVWLPVGIMHRRAVPTMLGQAVGTPHTSAPTPLAPEERQGDVERGGEGASDFPRPDA